MSAKQLMKDCFKGIGRCGGNEKKVPFRLNNGGGDGIGGGGGGKRAWRKVWARGTIVWKEQEKFWM